MACRCNPGMDLFHLPDFFLFLNEEFRHPVLGLRMNLVAHAGDASRTCGELRDLSGLPHGMCEGFLTIDVSTPRLRASAVINA